MGPRALRALIVRQQLTSCATRDLGDPDLGVLWELARFAFQGPWGDIKYNFDYLRLRVELLSQRADTGLL